MCLKAGISYSESVPPLSNLGVMRGDKKVGTLCKKWPIMVVYLAYIHTPEESFKSEKGKNQSR